MNNNFIFLLIEKRVNSILREQKKKLFPLPRADWHVENNLGNSKRIFAEASEKGERAQEETERDLTTMCVREELK